MDDTTNGPGGAAPDPVAGLTAAAREVWAAENRAAAARLTACYELFRQCVRRDNSRGGDQVRPGHAVIDPFDECAGFVVAAMPISTGRAETMISLAADLHERYPALLAAMTAGRMEQRAAELLARQMATVDPAVLAQVQQEVVDDYLAALESGERLGPRMVRQAADAIIGRHDPDALRRRKNDARRDRGVFLRARADGMATLWATLAADEAAVLAERLDQRAAEFAHPHPDPAAAGPAADPAASADAATADMSDYPLAERRADALLSLVCGDRGRTHATGLAPDEPSPPLRPRVTVFAPAPGAGAGTEPHVEFARTGDSALAALLDMLATSDGATLDRLDPALGAADDARRALAYKPSADLARRIRLRDGTCRHPGCTVTADNCDIDHVTPFDHARPDRGGRTTEDNLMCLCRRHHRFKTFSDWRYHLSPDGTLTVDAPDGSTILTRPSGPLAAYRRDHARTDTAAWTRQQTRNPDPTTDGDPTPEPTYWTRRAARHRTERRHTERRHTEPRPAPHTTRRWWTRNTPTTSTVEQEIRHLLDELLDPPPF